MFGLFGGAEDRRLAEVERRLAAIERKLDVLIRFHGLDGVPGVGGQPSFDQFGLNEAARLAADSDRKIEAIKILRDATGLGLKEAKEAVEAYVAARRR